jgi:hypothetical protein
MTNFNVPHITEKRYFSQQPQLLTADGNADGLITIASTYRIKVGQLLVFKSNIATTKVVKVQRVVSQTQFIVIDPKDTITTKNKLDMSMFLIADTATVEYSEDRRPVIDLLEIQRQVYEEEPTVALRSHLVDWLGRSYDKSNPVPVELSDGSISIGTVNAELEVQLSHQDNVPDVGDVHDSVRIGNGAYELEINSDGSINITDNNSSLTVDGTLDIGNFPATQSVAIVESIELEIKNDEDNPIPVSGTVTVDQGTDPWAIDGTVSASQSGTWNINNISGTVSLPTGAATSALQTTGNSSLSSIDGKTPTIGQKTMAGSSPVVIASDQSAIPITDNDSSLTVDGTVNVGNFPATQNVAVTSIVEVEVKNDVGNPLPISSSDVTASGTITAITQNVAISTVGKSVVDIQVTGTYTGALTPQITVDGTNWIALSTIRNINTNAIAATIASATQSIFQAEISGSTQFRIIANAAVTGTATIILRASLAKGPSASVTQAVSAAALPLPTGAATSALQTTGNTSLATIVTNTNGMSVAQGSTTTGQVGSLTQAAVTTTAPTYVNGQTRPLSLNTSGGLRVDGSDVTQPISGSVSVSNFPATQNVAVTSIVEVEVKNDSGNAIPISGTVAISSLPEVEIKNDSGNPIPVNGTVTANQGTDPWTVNGNVNTTITGTLPGINPDAFGRTRVSEPFTLGDYKHIYAIDPNFIDRVANGGVVSYNQNKACAMLTTSSNSASIAAHQTKFYHHYQPGKSQLVLTSACFGYAQQSVTKRTGYFDDRDGIYFEQVGDATANGTNNGQLNWVIRSYTSGTASEAAVGSYLRRVPQNQWNTDKCDGTGASGFNIDTSKTQLAWLDFQWLGVGRVRCGFVHDGAFIVAHEYHHSNALSEVYISNPNLPVRCEILNTGITAGGSMDQICSTVASEGGYIESGIDFAVTSGKRTTPSQGQTRFPLMAIRLKNSFNGYPNRLSVRPNQLSVYCTDNSIMYEVIKLPSASSMSTTLNGGVLTWTSADASSGVEYCVNATNFVSASADRFASGFVSSGSSQNSLSSVLSGTLTASKKNVISQNIESTDSEIYLVVVSTIEPGNNVTAGVVCGLQWREIY